MGIGFVTIVILAQTQSAIGGDIPEEDKALNDEAVRVGDGRTLAAYNTSKGEIWIITDFGDEGNVTTMLLPEEY